MAGVVLGTSVLQGLVRAPHARGYTSQRWTGTGDRVDDASQILLGAGQACLLQDWVSGPSNLLSFWPLYLRRSPREDAAMRARFGAAWEAWAARTGGVLSRP